MNSTVQSIEARVQQSLARIGLNDIKVIRAGEGHVTLTGKVESQDERSIALAMARTVAGVASVNTEFG